MSLNNAFSAASSGLQASSFRLQAHTLNVANVSTPYYRRRIPLLYAKEPISFSGVLGDQASESFPLASSNLTPGVKVAGALMDETPGKKIYEPNHPQADKDGYIQLSNVNVLTEMADSLVASRLYEANLAVVSLIKQMSTRALEIGRGQ